MWKKWANWLSVILTIVMLPVMLVQGLGELLIYGLGYLPRRVFNRKAKLTDNINAWLGILYWFLLVATTYAYCSTAHS